MMFSSKIPAAFFLFSIFYSKTTAEREIYVSPSGNDSSNCSKGTQCKTLDRALSLASGLNSTRIIASRGNYSLKTSHNFTRIATFGLFGIGSSRDDVQITCDANVSLSFTLSENITFEGVKFRKCGGWHRSSENYRDLKDAKFKTALDFRYCRNVLLSDVEISSSPGLGANLYDVGGVVNFTNSSFTDNYASNVSNNNNVRWESVTNNGSYVNSGGGVFILLNPYGSDTVNVTPSEHDSYQHNNKYIFTNCQFLRNKALWSNTTEEHELNTPELPFSRGGGLALYFRGNASGCIIQIQSCVFAGNKAAWGAGLQVEMQDNTENNSIVVESTELRENHALLAGGGAGLGILPSKGVQLRLNRFKITNCSFVHNKATWGGGTSVYGTTIPRKCTKHTDPAVTQFYFYRCNWLENVGNVGAALGAFLNNYNEDQIGPQIPYRVCFDNGTMFRSNKVLLSDHNLTIGQGSLNSVEVPLIFKNNATFENNTQSALLLDGSTIEVYDRLDFIGNTGYRGGAIAMYGRSRIILNESSALNFEENLCDDKGGALYIQAPGSPLVSFNATGTNIHACFFGYSDSTVDYDDWNTTVIFKGNNASLGTSVYATTLKNCLRAGESRRHNDVLKWKFVKFESPSQKNTLPLGEVATDPVNIKHNMADWVVAPGEVFNATVQLFDEIENPVPGIVNVTIQSSSVHLINPSSLFLTTDGVIAGISLRGEAGSPFSVELNYIGSQLLRKTIKNVTLKSCYTGFRFSDKTLSCECMQLTEEYARGVSRCGADRKTVYVKTGYWAGNINDTFVTYFCPTGYCNSSFSNSTEYRFFEGHVCNQTRKQTSVLCGECKDNYSITFGSEECCDSCTYWNLFYLVPFGVGLLLIVVIIMLIDLDFFTGYLNAWLYAYQIMKLLTPDGFEFDPFIEFVIAFTNIRVQVGDHSFCLAKGLDDADKLMIMYAIPTYTLLVVVVLKKLVDAYPDWCFSQRVKGPFRAICTILVLCYTDITRISLKMLHPAKVGSKTVLYDNGGLEFFHGKHLWYGIVAIIYILVFVLPFPLLLLFRPFLTQGLRPILNLNRWNPFFEPFQGCLKNQYRWCAAFYFLCRLGILVIHTYMPAGSIKRVVLEITCILILVTFTFLRPYKEAGDVKEGESSYEWINRSDVVLLTTLSLIAVISSPIDSSYPTTEQQKHALQIVVMIVSYVPLAVLLVLAYRVLKRYYPALDTENCFPPDDETLPLMSDTSDIGSNYRATADASVSRQSSRRSYIS